MKSKNHLSVSLFALLLILVSCSGEVHNYTIEDINDTDILKYPVPEPVDPQVHSYIVSSMNYLEEIDVSSPNLRNLSVTIANTGTGVIQNPYLFGPQGWDFRGNSTSFRSLAEMITRGELTKEQKFFRALEWSMLNFHRSELNNKQPRPNPYPGRYHHGNGPRLLNAYGSAMCGEFHDVVNPLLVKIPDADIHGCKYSMGGHTAGGAYWDGSWHDYNGSPTIQMAHYKMDGKTMATWAELKADPSPIDSVNKYIGHNGYYGRCFSPDSVRCPLRQSEYPSKFYDSDYLINFRYSDLRPEEKMTMYFDMRGRYDSTSVGYDTYDGRFPRNWVDYGSVVYTYAPNFHNDLYESFVVEESNVKHTKKGIVPYDPSQPSYIVFSSNHYPWYHVGADVTAWFKKSGNVYIARSNTIPGENLGADTLFTNYEWVKLEPDVKEYDNASITGKSCYWIKFEFEGKGSGIDSVKISSELQMSPWAMPGLTYGKNYIRFVAENMNGSTAKITYLYDKKSPYYFYEPAVSSTGKHIYHRLGGKLQQGHGLWKRPDFWVRLKDSTNVTANLTLRIFNVQNTSNISCVRTLFEDKPHKWGYYWWYWDGKDDQGNMLPPGMYAYRIDDTRSNSLVHTALLYLYPDGIWPVPNELRKGPPDFDY